MAQPTIASVRILGLHGHHSISVDLRPGLNIVHARNGMGKTTLLHVLANLEEAELERFCWIRFDRIIVTTGAGTIIELHQHPSGDAVRVQLIIDGQLHCEVTPAASQQPIAQRLLSDALGGRPVYLPAFRSILEAVSRRRYELRSEREARADEIAELVKRELRDAPQRRADASWHRARDSAELTAMKTLFCREWFGRFVPVIRCPSLAEVSDELAQELSDARIKVVSTDVEVSGHVFVQVLRAVLREQPPGASDWQSIERMFKTIREYLDSLPEEYKDLTATLWEIPDPQSFRDRETLAKVLPVYEQALSRRVQASKTAYRRIETFLDSVNKFLEEPKRLAVDVARARGSSDGFRHGERVVVDAGSRKTTLRVLSSGERQVLTLLFSATHMSSGDGLLLIDEPELSLHLNWQRILLSELMAQAGERQVIVCTHAPELATEHQDEIRDLVRVPWVPLLEQSELELSDDKDAVP